MATLYWGGGSGTWDGFTTTNWYTDLARTVLAGRAPAADDDVIFDSSSHTTAYTVTISGNTTVCRSCTIEGPPGGELLTFAGSGQWYIYGDLTFNITTSFVRTFNGTITFYATDSRTITTSGITFVSQFNFAGVGGTWTLQDALTTDNIFITAGTLNTNGKQVTCTSKINGTGGTLTLGASSVSASSIGFSGPVTVNGGTSTVNLSSTLAGIGESTGFTGGTFYNVNITSNAIEACNIYGNNTFNNLTFSTPAAARVSMVTLFGNQTINGTLGITGADGAKRYFVQSDTIGTTRTLTVAARGTLRDVDFRDITVAGASSPWSGTRLGDCKGNTNITFVAGANKYIAAATASSNWSANIWATSSGGSAATGNFPLAQDTVIIDNAGLNTSATLTLDIAYNIGGFDTSSRTNAMTFSSSVFPSCYGDLNIGTNVTSSVAGSTNWTFAGRNTQNITTNGKVWAGVIINSPSGTVKLIDNFTPGTGGGRITLTNGTFDANNKNITCNRITATGSASKTLTLGSGTISTTVGVGSSTAVSNLTVTSNTAAISGGSSETWVGFNGITATFGGTVTINGASNRCDVYGTTTVANLTLPATSGNLRDRMQLAGNLTVTGTLAFAGSATATQRLFVRSDIIGTQRTLSAATVTGLSNIDFRDINATGAANWAGGTNLGDCGGNAGITFAAAKTVYWNLAGATNWASTAWATTSGGTPAAANFPLPQDTAVFNNTGSVGTVTIIAYNIGTIDAVGRTSAWTLDGSGIVNIYGDVTYGSGITASTTATYVFSGRGTQTFSTAGKSLSSQITIDKPAGTFQHGSAFTSTDILITSGTYTTQNYNITLTGAFQIGLGGNTSAKSVTLGTSTLTLSGISTVFVAETTNLTFNGASSTINLSRSGGKTFAGGGLTYGTVSATGGLTTQTLTITGSNKFGTLTNTARTQLLFTSGTTQEVTTFTYSGASGNVVRWYTNIPGQRATIKTTSSAVGTNSTNGGNNDGLTFTGTSPDYFYVKDIAYSALAVAGTANFLMFFN